MRQNNTNSTRVQQPTRQTLSMQKSAPDSTAVYKDYAGNEVKLSLSMIKKYICPNASDQDAVLFLSLCKYQGLNPWTNDAFLISYGGKATMVVGKEAFTKKAQKSPHFRGFTAGVTVVTTQGVLEDRKGEIVLPGEDLVGGWAEVRLDNWEIPHYTSVNFDEYCQKKDGKPTKNWAEKPATMIRKVALVHALREAFPNDLSGCYAPEEMGVNEDELPKTPIPTPQPNEAVDVDYEPVADPTTGEVTDEDEQGDIFG